MKDFTDRLRQYSGWIKVLILAGTLVFMFLKLQKEFEDLGKASEPGDLSIPLEYINLFWISLLLMPLNLSLEAWKWQTIAGKIEQISFKQSMAGVLSGDQSNSMTSASSDDNSEIRVSVISLLSSFLR